MYRVLYKAQAKSILLAPQVSISKNVCHCQSATPPYNTKPSFIHTIRPTTTNTMTTITLKSQATSISLPEDFSVNVSLPEGFSEKQLLSFQPFKNWLETLTKSLTLQSQNPSHPFHSDPYALRSITIQSYDLFGSSKIGFLKLSAEVTNSFGESLPGAVFLRGPSVGMLVMLIPDDLPPSSGQGVEEERYVILTIQPRVPAGSLAFAELPAGMIGGDGGSFAGTAAREIKEELGIEIPASELISLSELAAAPPVLSPSAMPSSGNSNGDGSGEVKYLPQAMYPSAGGCDEYIPIYMHERRVPRSTLKEWTGKLTGLRNEGEKITLKLVPMRDLWREGRRDAKALAALALWEGLKREGRLL
ncbi:hypothetical protein F5Y16DRAFT_364363 [Xylariaceae sp. FL0255]|nr:hypothetical protein F5Y16DRAFT_364363 [Xylariaceae sp. FL0255]